MKGHYVRLIPESPFYSAFARSVFGLGRAPVLSPLPVQVQLEGSDEIEAYMLDFERVSQDEIERIIAILARQSGEGADVIHADILRSGLPIRASQVCGASSDGLFFL